AYRDKSLPEIKFWAVKLLQGDDNQAYLKATLVQAFTVPTTVGYLQGLALHGNLFARLSYRFVEVYDWVKSSSEVHFTAVISFRFLTINCIHLLPSHRLLVFTDNHIMIYDLCLVTRQAPFTVAPTQEPTPRWELPCPSHSLISVGGLSAPSHDDTASFLTFVACTTVYGLIIPRDIDAIPRIINLAHFPMTLPFTSVCLGFGKIFAQSEYGILTRGSFNWDQDEHNTEECTHYPLLADYPSNWPEDTEGPPLLDEYSGRVVRCWERKGIYIVDPPVR
ncbi:hypothetical protein C0991_001741, partial [Blastosporella zonata]